MKYDNSQALVLEISIGKVKEKFASLKDWVEKISDKIT